ncbi:hypothetical protein MMC17_008695 [Xylographa soralifera]|nr:hypothetical protein [Xylographa soralifera]
MSTDSSTAVTTLKTIDGEITLDAALEEEQNMLRRLTYLDKRKNFLVYLLDHSTEIEAVVSYHLGLSKAESCCLAPLNEWVHGSFNMCIPVYIRNWKARPEKRVMIRFPLPYKIGGDDFPRNADEKLRCEAATYIWIQKNCPDVPIPRLWGFAFQDNQCFTSLGSIPWFVRLMEYCRRYLRSLFRRPPLCPYICRRQPYNLKPGYLLLEYIENNEGVMLSETWEEKRQDKSRRTNLFRDLSRIILSLGRIPLTRIGSFTLDNTGVLSLSNRPLTLRLHELENGGIPIDMARGDTYTAVESYIVDLLAYHDSRLRYQPNSINDEPDCRAQMAAITGMRAVLPYFIDRDFRNGPFLFTLTDIHQSNLYVDEQWHIKRLIDLEWACSLPMPMQNPPYWLTSQAVDHLTGEDFAEYEKVHKEFMEAFEQEEKLQNCWKLQKDNNDLPRTRTMRKVWETGSFFYFHALDSTTGLFNLWGRIIQPMFSNAGNLNHESNRLLAPYWCIDAENVVAAKMKDREAYIEQLEAIFEAETQVSPS